MTSTLQLEFVPVTEPPHFTILYGPYFAHGIIKHRLQRLNGLIDRLTELGHDFTLKPIPHMNRLSVTMRGREIFRCNIHNLYFNMEFDGDVVAQRAVGAIEEAIRRFFDAKNQPEFDSVKLGTRDVHKFKERGRKPSTQFVNRSLEKVRDYDYYDD